MTLLWFISVVCHTRNGRSSESGLIKSTLSLRSVYTKKTKNEDSCPVTNKKGRFESVTHSKKVSYNVLLSKSRTYIHWKVSFTSLSCLVGYVVGRLNCHHRFDRTSLEMSLFMFFPEVLIHIQIQSNSFWVDSSQRRVSPLTSRTSTEYSSSVTPVPETGTGIDEGER